MSKQPAAGVTDDDDLDGETGGVARTNSGDAKAEEDVAVQVGDYVLGRTLGAGEHRELIMRHCQVTPRFSFDFALQARLARSSLLPTPRLANR